MNSQSEQDLPIEPYRGQLAPSYRSEAWLELLARPGALLSAASTETVSAERNRNARVTVDVEGQQHDLFIKSFERWETRYRRRFAWHTHWRVKHRWIHHFRSIAWLTRWATRLRRTTGRCGFRAIPAIF